MNGRWPWLALAALGMFHGINPAMGWLFAVALGMHRASRAVVVLALLPIALGHALAIGVVVALVLALGVVIDAAFLQVIGGLVLVGWAVYHRLYGRGHRARVGMRTGFAGLTLWSFLMASAHGAGLMLVPVLVPLELAGGHRHGAMPGDPLGVALLAIAVHTLAMLVTTGAVSVLVYEWVGLAFLRRGWINLDLVWTMALIGAGCLLLIAGALGTSHSAQSGEWPTGKMPPMESSVHLDVRSKRPKPRVVIAPTASREPPSADQVIEDRQRASNSSSIS